jgi:hypothetical protein
MTVTTVIAPAARIALAVLIVLGGVLAWVEYPAFRDYRLAENFCSAVQTGTTTVDILQKASATPGARVTTSNSGVIIVKFGLSQCWLWLKEGTFSGKASATSID